MSAATQSLGSPAPSSVEQELADFSYIVSHDLAASLRYVGEFSHLLLDDIGESATGTQRAYARQIENATQKSKAMLDQILSFSRVQQKALDLQPVDVTRLMEVAALQLSAEVRAAGADIAIEPLGEHMVDADLMTLAFKHVLDNALKFRRPDTPCLVDVRGGQTADGWTVEIIDNGIGIAVERQDKAFRMFYQDHLEGAYPGVGAGLAICRRVLRRHGGDARFLKEECGTRLQMSFPITSSELLS